MKQHSFRSHTPEEMRRLSNLVHIIEGALITVVGVLVLLGKFAGLAWALTLWPILILIAGIGLLLILYPLHPVSEWGLIWNDAQQRQHTILAIAIAIAGLAQMLSSSTSPLRYVWPLAVIITGGLFLVHTQHGTSEAAAKAGRRHQILGMTLIAAGLFNLIEVASGAKFAAIVWPMLLIIAAVQLVVYREPEGAYETDVKHASHAEH